MLNIQQKPTETQDQFIERLKSEHRSIVSALEYRMQESEKRYRDLQEKFNELPSGAISNRQVQCPTANYTAKTYNIVEKVYKCSIDTVRLARVNEEEKYEILQQLLTAEVIKDKGLPIEIAIDARLGIAVLRLTLASTTEHHTEAKIIYFNQ